MNEPQPANQLAITSTDNDTFYSDDTWTRKSTSIFNQVLVLLLIYMTTK